MDGSWAAKIANAIFCLSSQGTEPQTSSSVPDQEATCWSRCFRRTHAGDEAHQAAHGFNSYSFKDDQLKEDFNTFPQNVKAVDDQDSGGIVSLDNLEEVLTSITGDKKAGDDHQVKSSEEVVVQIEGEDNQLDRQPEEVAANRKSPSNSLNIEALVNSTRPPGEDHMTDDAVDEQLGVVSEVELPVASEGTEGLPPAVPASEDISSSPVEAEKIQNPEGAADSEVAMPTKSSLKKMSNYAPAPAQKDGGRPKIRSIMKAARRSLSSHKGRKSKTSSEEKKEETERANEEKKSIKFEGNVFWRRKSGTSGVEELRVDEFDYLQAGVRKLLPDDYTDEDKEVVVRGVAKEIREDGWTEDIYERYDQALEDLMTMTREDWDNCLVEMKFIEEEKLKWAKSL